MKRSIIITGLIIILTSPIWMALGWLFEGKKELKVVMVDKTTLTNDGIEHRSFNWVLDNDKYCMQNRSLYSISRDYYGFFPKDKVALTGNPVRKSLLIPAREGAYEFLKLRHDLPILLVLGGSQGAQTINEVILAALPELVGKYQVVHQTGDDNFKEVSGRAKVVLADNINAANYKPFGYLNDLAMRMSAGVASLVISRAGSGSGISPLGNS